MTHAGWPGHTLRDMAAACKNAAIAAAKDELGNDGRILVRASGTEPLIRVMGEGSDKDRLERVIDDIVSVVEQELGEE